MSAPRITEGELKALRLAANGRTAGQIAQILGTTETGIQIRLRHAAHSLGAKSRPHLVALALTFGYLNHEDIVDRGRI